MYGNKHLFLNKFMHNFELKFNHCIYFFIFNLPKIPQVKKNRVDMMGKDTSPLSWEGECK